MESKIEWQSCDEYITLKVKLPKEEFNLHGIILGKDSPEKMQKLGERLRDFFTLIISHNFLTINGGTVSFGIEQQTVLNVSILL